MIAFVAALSLAQPLVIDRAELPADSPTTAEILQRPSGVAAAAFLDQLIAEAGAAQWRRIDRTVPYRNVELRIVGLVRTEGDGLMFFLPAAEGATGNICRIRRVREGQPGPESEAALHYCLGAVAEGR
jgi:hypothetical protein